MKYYPNTIDGKPAARVDYVSDSGATIVTAYQPQPRDARRAVSDIYAALGALERATRKASNGGKDGATIQATTPRKAGSIVAAYAMVSIHAPTRGATAVNGVWIVGRDVSIHAPTRGATFSAT